jgi:hypothetical protein
LPTGAKSRFSVDGKLPFHTEVGLACFTFRAIEQPEIHLDPALQAELADVFTGKGTEGLFSTNTKVDAV